MQLFRVTPVRRLNNHGDAPYKMQSTRALEPESTQKSYVPHYQELTRKGNTFLVTCS